MFRHALILYALLLGALLSSLASPILATAESWSVLSDSPISARRAHTAVWTGSEMIVWGGVGGAAGVCSGGREGCTQGELADGARYGPNTNVWKVLPGSPLSRRGAHTAIWTGHEMIIWGGIVRTNVCVGLDGPVFCPSALADGARYDPSANSWKALPGSPLRARWGHTAIWTGSQMIIWGGHDKLGYFSDGARYDPGTNTWTLLPSSPLTGRDSHTAIWTGTEMVVWGGVRPGGDLVDGARYDPSTNAWTLLPDSPLGEREGHTAVWTGSEMIVWGGLHADSSPADPLFVIPDGARYNVGADAWTAVADSPLRARSGYTAIWTGRGMMIWGGYSGSFQGGFFANGAVYDPSTDTWASLPDSPLGPRDHHTAVWTGSEMIVWGGSAVGGRFEAADGARYKPDPGSPTELLSVLGDEVS